jgi:hypothetical protein
MQDNDLFENEILAQIILSVCFAPFSARQSPHHESALILPSISRTRSWLPMGEFSGPYPDWVRLNDVSLTINLSPLACDRRRPSAPKPSICSRA